MLPLEILIWNFEKSERNFLLLFTSAASADPQNVVPIRSRVRVTTSGHQKQQLLLVNVAVEEKKVYVLKFASSRVYDIFTTIKLWLSLSIALPLLTPTYHPLQLLLLLS